MFLMANQYRKVMGACVLGLLVMLVIPLPSMGQGIAGGMKSLHGVLDGMYDDMMPLCGRLIGVAQAIAGFAATWYIASRVWRHIARAEQIDFYPLFRPFVLGFCIMIFPSVLGLMNGIMQPAVNVTAGMVEGSNEAVKVLLKQKEEALKRTEVWQMYVGEGGEGDRDRWYKYTYDKDPAGEGILGSIGNDILFGLNKMAYRFSINAKAWMSEILRVLFEAASLCIDTLRTFQLVVLSILGPLVFGLAIFDGFRQTLTSWMARYINVFLWLPVANIFGAIIGRIQQKMVAMDIGQIGQTGDTFFSPTDVAYLVFLIIGIVGYFSVPSVAGYIVHPGGHGGLLQKTTMVMSAGSSTAVAAASGGVSKIAGVGVSLVAGRGGHGAMNSGESGGRPPSGGYLADKVAGR